MSSSSTSSSDGFMKQPQKIRYSYSFDQELSRLLGAFTFFATNRQHERAFWNLWLAILHVIKDPKKRLFVEQKTEGQAGTTERDFLKMVKLFASLFGSGPSLDGKFSYLDLRPREKPKADEDRVWITRHVRIMDVWGRYSYESLTTKIGFVYVEKKLNAAGFPVEIINPMFSFTDNNIMKKVTNAVPYSYWEQEARLVLNELIPVAKEIEHILAGYLHGDYEADSKSPAGRSDQSSTVPIPSEYFLGDTDSMGYDYGTGQSNNTAIIESQTGDQEEKQDDDSD